MTLAYYNEFDPFAAAWLRELIVDGLIAPGLVDERSIEDVTPNDLHGFDQCHFFAGIGVWSLAARQAGWPDDRPLWTGSCPCPPFSSAGPNFKCPVCDSGRPVPNAVRTGAFNCIVCGHEWQADDRHLWPEFFRLIRHYPDVPVVGEQVASADGRVWIDLVRASLEMLGRTVGVVDTCVAGFGAPHIRQRDYWVADATGSRWGWSERDADISIEPVSIGTEKSGRWGATIRLADSVGQGLEGRAEQAVSGTRRRVEGDGTGRGDPRLVASVGLANAVPTGRTERRAGTGVGPTAGSGGASGLEFAGSIGRERREAAAQGHDDDRSASGRSQDQYGAGQPSASGLPDDTGRPGPTNGYWRDADWLRCTDGKWRPVESGTFPLADAGSFRNRVGELRGAGNAVTLAQAEAFLRVLL